MTTEEAIQVVKILSSNLPLHQLEHDALDHILSLLCPPLPDENMAEVRVAVCVNSEGEYFAKGNMNGDAPNDDVDSLIGDGLEQGDAIYWLTARLAKPAPPKEVAAEMQKVQP